MLISVTGLTVGDSVELYRVASGERSALRAGADADVSDTSFLRVDAEMPFGVPVSYLAVVNGSDEYTTAPASYTLPGGKVAVTDAISGASAEVVILAWDEKASSRQSSVFKVGGRNVVVSGDMGMFESDLELFTETTSTRDNLRALLAGATEGVVQIRQPGGYDGVDSYLAVLGTTERRFSQDGSDQRRIFALSVAEVEGWAPMLEARGTTLQDIADAYASTETATLVGDYLFNATTESWFASGGTLARVATPSDDGDGSLRWTMDTGDDADGVQSPTGSSALPVPAPGSYRITYKIMTPHMINPVTCDGFWYDAFGDFIEGLNGKTLTLTPNVWTELVLEAVAPAGAAFLRTDIGLIGTTAGNLLYVDSVTVELLGGGLSNLADDYATLLDIAQGEFA
ncbi:hypothetical protein [Micromonospora avicenniae]|uniref:hypothetical protein n=1 Tax=Micromonospora avicenniae TaxID=1198245 RepID=UPI0011155DF4|nr:hypothetical protein [Micromonospora avicenniae]